MTYCEDVNCYSFTSISVELTMVWCSDCKAISPWCPDRVSWKSKRFTHLSHGGVDQGGLVIPTGSHRLTLHL